MLGMCTICLGSLLLGFNKSGIMNPSLFLGVPGILVLLNMLLVMLLPLNTELGSGLPAGKQCLINGAVFFD